MRKKKSLLFLFAGLALSFHLSTGEVEGQAECDYMQYEVDGWTCITSWCAGTTCNALDCVWPDGRERHYISPGCGVSTISQ